MTEDTEAKIGFPDRWQLFTHRNSKFLANGYPFLIDLSHAILNRPLKINSVADDSIHLLGKSAMEDFFELWVLAGNGYGFGALKILRGLFEKIVTAGYLAHNLAEAQQFVDYGAIQDRKLLNFIRQNKKAKHLVPDDVFLAANEAHKAVADKYKIADCASCGRSSSPNWSSLDVVSMARRAGFGIADWLPLAYALPNLKIHATAPDLASRKLPIGNGQFQFSAEPQERESDASLMAGAFLITANLSIQNLHFGLERDAEIGECLKRMASDFGEDTAPS